MCVSVFNTSLLLLIALLLKRKNWKIPSYQWSALCILFHLIIIHVKIKLQQKRTLSDRRKRQKGSKIESREGRRERGREEGRLRGTVCRKALIMKLTNYTVGVCNWIKTRTRLNKLKLFVETHHCSWVCWSPNSTHLHRYKWRIQGHCHKFAHSHHCLTYIQWHLCVCAHNTSRCIRRYVWVRIPCAFILQSGHLQHKTGL